MNKWNNLLEETESLNSEDRLDHKYIKKIYSTSGFYYDEGKTSSPSSALDKQIGGDHYKTLKIQPVEYNMKNNLGWCEGNIVKYITRWKQKGGVDDIKKVIHYATILLESVENDS